MGDAPRRRRRPRGSVTPAMAALSRSARLTERQAWAVLTWVDGLGPVGFGALLRAFGSGRAVLEAALRAGATRRLVEAGVVDERESFDATTAGAIAAVAEDPRAVLRRIEIPGVEILTTEDAAYPSRLRSSCRRTSCRSRLGRGDGRGHAVAVVGTRRPTEAAGDAGRDRRSLAKAGAVVVRAPRSHRRGEPRGGDGGRRGHGGCWARATPALPAGPREARRADRHRRRRGRPEFVPDRPPSAHSRGGTA